MPDYEDRYQVSTEGCVWSLRRKRPLKTWPGRGGYPTVFLWNGARTWHVPVHVLVLETFVGPRPEGADARHLDGDAQRPVLANLEWGTRAQNIADSVVHGTHANASKTHCPQRHPYDEGNTRWYRGARKCRACEREANWRRRGTE